MKEFKNRLYKKYLFKYMCRYGNAFNDPQKKEMHESKFLLLNKENVCMHGKSLSNIFQYIF